jgi:serine/threonine protein phosphatase PrpC
VKLSDVGPHLTVHSAGLTDTGKVRVSNQDQFLIAELLNKPLRVQWTSLPSPTQRRINATCSLAADGMGGHAGREEASAFDDSSRRNCRPLRYSLSVLPRPLAQR